LCIGSGLADVLRVSRRGMLPWPRIRSLQESQELSNQQAAVVCCLHCHTLININNNSIRCVARLSLTQGTGKHPWFFDAETRMQRQLSGPCQHLLTEEKKRRKRGEKEGKKRRKRRRAQESTFVDSRYRETRLVVVIVLCFTVGTGAQIPPSIGDQHEPSQPSQRLIRRRANFFRLRLPGAALHRPSPCSAMPRPVPARPEA
jgi:hypothetical protein